MFRILVVILVGGVLLSCRKNETQIKDVDSICECSQSDDQFERHEPSDPLVTEFERLAEELKGMERGSDCYGLITDAKNSKLWNRHLELKQKAVDYLAKGLLSRRQIEDQWHLMCRWYQIMQMEGQRLRFKDPIFDIAEEVDFAERQMALGWSMGLYTDEDLSAIKSMLDPFLDGRVRSGVDIKRTYGLK